MAYAVKGRSVESARSGSVSEADKEEEEEEEGEREEGERARDRGKADELFSSLSFFALAIEGGPPSDGHYQVSGVGSGPRYLC